MKNNGKTTKATQNEKNCREIISLLFNGAITDQDARGMLVEIPSGILTDVIIDTFNRVQGCFEFNETFVSEEA